MVRSNLQKKNKGLCWSINGKSDQNIDTWFNL